MSDKILVDRDLLYNVLQAAQIYVNKYAIESGNNSLYIGYVDELTGILLEESGCKSQEPEFCECERPKLSNPLSPLWKALSDACSIYCVICNKPWRADGKPKEEKISLEECVRLDLYSVFFRINAFTAGECGRCGCNSRTHQLEHKRQKEINKIEAEAEHLCNLYWRADHSSQEDMWRGLSDPSKNIWRVLAKDVLERQKG